MTDYTQTKTLRKGAIGEKLCKRWLENEHEYVVFTTDTQLPHDIDIIATKKGKWKEYIFCEVKTKCAREHYPDTGFDKDDYDHYLELAKTHNVKIFLFFADECGCTIYGQWLSELQKETTITHGHKTLSYPWFQSSSWGDIVYFPLEAMKPITDIDEDTCFEIQQLTESNYK